MFMENTRNWTITHYKESPWPGILVALLFFLMVLSLLVLCCVNITDASSISGERFSQPADSWLNAMQSGNFNQLYAQLTPHLQTRFKNPAGMETYFSQMGLVPQSWQVKEPLLQEDRVIVPARLTLQNGGQKDVELVYTLDAAEWKIDLIRFSD